MSDYTPATEEVREAFASRFWDDYSVYQPTEEDLDEERTKFYRWLAEVKREAKEEAWEEGLEAKFKLLEGQESVSLDNPYRQGENK